MTGGWLNTVERVGNRLPDPSTLFALGTLVVMLLSGLAVTLGWRVVRTVERDGALVAEPITPVSLLDADGIWWLLSNLVDNFVEFPPLGLVLVGLLGIGVAERSGLLPVLLRRLLAAAPARLLVPMTVFVGVLSSLALDAGYVVLPPLAGALFLAAGRAPLAGIAAVTAGVTCGFSANLFLTGLDPLLAGLSTAAAQLLDPDYEVAISANWWFMIVSTLLLTATGAFVTGRFVEPRLPRPAADDTRAGLELPPNGVPAQGAPSVLATSRPPDGERNEDRGLRFAGWTFAVLMAVLLASVLFPGAPLAGEGDRFPRWMEVLVPILLILFLGTGLAYGIGAGSIRRDRDAVEMMGETMRTMGPYLVLAFFAAQFIACFGHSRLGEMLAVVGGGWLAQLALEPAALMVAFVVVVMAGNLLIGSASAKYAFFAPVFVPMFMQAGIAPELTQAAYRVGDSVTNGITPFNPYLIIILAFIRRYRPDAGLGTLVALMLPYTLVFAPIWAALLGLWVAAGWPLGPGGGLAYPSGG
jgi:aminobenzoyl-glutamate transport protein